VGGAISTRAPWICPVAENEASLRSTNEPSGNATAGGPYDSKLEAIGLLSIFNKRGSGKVIRIREVEICPIAPALTAYVLSKLTLSRITDASGGSADGTVTKLDSNSAALSDITFLTNSAVTTSEAVLFNIRQLPAYVYYWYGLGSASFMYPYIAPAQGLRGLNASQHDKLGIQQVYVWKTHGDSQRIIIRNGEGIAMHTDQNACLNLEYDISVWIRNSSTGACYCLHMLAVSQDGALFSVMNGGATPFEIVRVELTEQGPSLGPVYTIENIADMIPANGGEQVVPTSLDSQNVLSADVLCYKNGYVRLEGYDSGASISRAIKMMVNGRGPTVGPDVAMGPLPLRNPIFTSKNEQDYVLREGCGMAVFNRGWANNADCDVIINFTQESAASGGGGISRGRIMP
jgi:hypothetical protein